MGLSTHTHKTIERLDQKFLKDFIRMTQSTSYE